MVHAGRIPNPRNLLPSPWLCLAVLAVTLILLFVAGGLVR